MIDSLGPGSDAGGGDRRARPRVLVVAAGGTIASEPVGGTALNAPVRSGRDLVAAVPELDALAAIDVEEFSVVLSSQLTARDVFDLSRRVVQALEADPGLAGVVVTHGTGTLEESAFMADLLVNDPRPVVYTGAMRTGGYGDGRANLLDAVRVAIDGSARGRGVLVVLNGTIHAARYAVKSHTTALGAFRSTGIGPVGRTFPDRVEVAGAPVVRQHLPAEDPVFDVDLVKFVVGMDDRHVRASVAAGAAAIVVEGSGLGNLNSLVAPGILDALEQGVVVALASRTGDGRVFPYYATEASGGWLAERGCLLSSLPGPKTRILLMLALARTRDPAQLQELLDPVAG